MPKFVLFIFLVFISYSLQAQTYEFGAGAGAAGYMGDLNISNPLKVSGPEASLFFKYNFDGYWGARLNFTLGQISGADSTSSSTQQRQRNLSFTTNLSEVSLVGEFNFFKYIPEIGKNRFTPYVYFGVAIAGYNPTTIYQGTKYSLRDLETEGEKKPYPSSTFSIPYGVGVRYNILGRLTLGAEIGYRNSNTDYLDDVSGYYPDKNKLSSPVSVALSDRSGEKTGVYVGSPGTQRGDLAPRDTYFFTQITISYTIITRKCYFEN